MTPHRQEGLSARSPATDPGTGDAPASTPVSLPGPERASGEAGPRRRNSIRDDLHRLADLLRLDAAGIVTAERGRPRTYWWGEPGVELPPSIDDVAAGSVPGWIATTLPGGSRLFARITPRSSIRTPAVLQAVGPVLAASVGLGVPEDERDDAAGAPGDPAPDVPDPLGTALQELRDDLGFETVSLFVRGGSGWELLRRRGPVRAWHAVLDPSAIEDMPDAAEHRDVRALPGVGARLAGLGCESLATLPVPDGGRVVLDSSIPCPEGGWIERARPYLALLAIMAGPSWSAGATLRNYQEIATIQGVFTACQDVLEREGPAVQDLLDEVRLALRAEHVFLLTERGPEVEVAASPAERWPDRLPRDAAALLRPSDQAGLDPEVLRRLTLALGIPSRSVVGGQGRESGRVEVLVAGWSDGLQLSPVSMTVVARAVSTARAALRGRGEAVTSQVDRERTRMAYALHDGVIQTVASAVLELEALRKRFERDPARALATLEHSKTEIRRSLSELRAVLAGLSKEPDEEHGPEPLTRYVDDVVRRWRLPAQVSVEGDVNDVPARILSVAYVVIREALANAAKHASAGNVSVTLAARDGELEVTVDDGGRGFTEADEREARQAHHFGLDMLRRRVREVGGELLVDSAPGKGTRVLARLPVSEVAP